MEYDKIEKRANKVLNAFYECYPKKGRIDISTLADFFGFEVIQKKFIRNLDSCLYVVSGSELSLVDTSEKRIEVNKFLTYNEKRYLIAYELAYYLLYYDKREVFVHRNYYGEIDIFVQDFADLLLVPSDDLMKMYNYFKENNSVYRTIILLSLYFEVSVEVIERRMEKLGLILKNKFKKIRK